MQNPFSMFFGKLFGIYLVLVGLAFLTRREWCKKAIIDIADSAGLMAVTGMIGILLGSSVVITHNLWLNSWEVVVTTLGWLLLVQGAGRLLAPHFLARCLKGIAHQVFALFTWIWLLIGAYLLWSVST